MYMYMYMHVHVDKARYWAWVTLCTHIYMFSELVIVLVSLREIRLD